MAHPSGMKTRRCRYCGRSYTLTNFMRRRRDCERDDEGRILDDTHLIACFKRHKAQEDSDAKQA